MDYEKRLLKNIRQRRKQLGVTQADIAHELGVSQAVYSQWETNATALTVNRYFEICYALRLNPKFLINQIKG